jgi:hypothetical protein
VVGGSPSCEDLEGHEVGAALQTRTPGLALGGLGDVRFGGVRLVCPSGLHWRDAGRRHWVTTQPARTVRERKFQDKDGQDPAV